MSLLLSENVAQVVLQFSFTQLRLRSLLEDLTERPRESEEEHRARVLRADEQQTGRLAIQKTEAVNCQHFLAEFNATGFWLTGAFWQLRILRNLRGRYRMARFTFSAPDQGTTAIPDSSMVASRLEGLLSIALWRVRAYDNPHFSQGQSIEGQRQASINFEVPLLRELKWYEERQPPIANGVLRVTDRIVHVQRPD